MTDAKGILVACLAGFGIVFAIAGVIRQMFQFNGAQNWFSNDLYVTGVVLVVMAVAVSWFWKV